jgi:hypothetical protein
VNFVRRGGNGSEGGLLGAACQSAESQYNSTEIIWSSGHR